MPAALSPPPTLQAVYSTMLVVYRAADRGAHTSESRFFWRPGRPGRPPKPARISGTRGSAAEKRPLGRAAAGDLVGLFAVVRVLRQVDRDHGRGRDHAALGHHFDAPCEHAGVAGEHGLGGDRRNQPREPPRRRTLRAPPSPPPDALTCLASDAIAGVTKRDDSHMAISTASTTNRSYLALKCFEMGSLASPSRLCKCTYALPESSSSVAPAGIFVGITMPAGAAHIQDHVKKYWPNSKSG